MEDAQHGRLEERVLLLPATQRDGVAICRFLEKESFHFLVCRSASQMSLELERGAAVLVLTDSALAAAGAQQIIDALLRQPSWSDLPVLVLGRQEAGPEIQSAIQFITNVTWLDRPASSRTLLSAIATSLRTRARQYQLRDQMSALHEAEQALRQADRRKDEFLAMLAHELRNPLAPIRTAVELLARIVPRGDQRVDTTLDVVRRQVTQLTRLVDDLLDVSRITRGRIELRCVPLDLESVVDQALEAVAPLMRERRHVVERHVTSPSPHVDGDGTRMVQCVSNLLSNAAKYTDPGGRIRVGLSQAGQTAVISVADNGIGIGSDMLPRVFDLFVQNERSLDRSQGGLGIGLSVVKRLVSMHQGRVEARSDGLGKGSTFEIHLPVVPAPGVQPAPPKGAMAEARRVLVVDDNRDAADSLSLLLRLNGHEVQTAYDGQQALAIAPAFHADLVLLDIGLPEIDGFEVARRLRSGGSHARLVALTGYGQPEDLRHSREAGFDEHLVKPVEFERVEQMLRASAS